jgi:predicted transposase YbfD/YdcC
LEHLGLFFWSFTMEGSAITGPLRFFLDLPDPRAANVSHRLIDIIVISICAVICDADGWQDFEDFADAKSEWLKTFMDLRHGVPSADTFRRVLSALDPDAFERCFMNWMQSVVTLAGGKLVAIDGKSLRRSFQHGWDKSGMSHLVSCFVQDNGQVFTQLKTEGKGAELAGIMRILGVVDLRGATVTIDAIACQKNVCRTIIDRGGDYLIAVKENQKSLHASIKKHLDEMILEKFTGVPHDHDASTDTGHGRIEQRKVWVINQIDWLRMAGDWPGLKSVAVVEATRDVPAIGRSTERRYYISSVAGADARFIAQAIRGHWSIENGLHHVLDVSFHEDDSRIRKDNGAQNMSRLRRIALNLLKEKGPRFSKRASIRGRRKIAGWDHQFLLNLIAG